MIAGTEPVKKAKEQKQPTYEGTDEYRKEKDIPLEEFKSKGVNKNKSNNQLVKKSGFGPKASKGKDDQSKELAISKYEQGEYKINPFETDAETERREDAEGK